MDIQQLIQKVEAGARFSVDFRRRSLKLNGKHVIGNGKCTTTDIPSGEYTLDGIKLRYRRYRNSIPSERSDRRRRNYFVALPLEQLTDNDMMFGMRRETARFELELYVLLAIVTGSLRWNDFAEGKWFWKSPDCPGLILLKEWFEQPITTTTTKNSEQ